MVSKEGSQVIAGGIDLIGDNIKVAQGSSKEVIFFADAVLLKISLFVIGMHWLINLKVDKK